MVFRNRKEAGIKLAEKLIRYANNPIVIVLGLARGGVAVAAESPARWMYPCMFS